MIDGDRDQLALPGRDRLEFSGALLLGAAIGLLAVRSVRSTPGPGERIQRRMRRPLKKVRRQGRATRESAGRTVGEGARLGDELRELATEFLDAARSELVRAAPTGSAHAHSSGLSAALSGIRAFRSRWSSDR